MSDRFSVKKFNSNLKLSSEQINELVECFRLSPSSLNLQAWKLIVVSDEKMKERLAKAGRNDNSKRIKECSHFFVLTRKKLSMSHFEKVIDSTEILKLTIKKRKMRPWHMKAFFYAYSMFMGRKKWSTNQLYIALGVLLAACAKMRIGALPMEGINCRQIDKILNLPSEFRTVVGLCVGYPHEREETNPSRLRKSRFSQEEVCTFV